MSIAICSSNPNTSYYRVADRIIKIKTLDSWSATLLENSLNDYVFEHLIAAPRPAPDICVKAEVKACLSRIPAQTEVFDISQGRCHHDGTNFWLEVCDSLVIVKSAPDFGHCDVEIQFGETSLAQEPLSIETVCLYGFQFALRRCGLYIFHAAAVSEPQSGRSALIIGDSGCGKSTLTVQLINCGWQFLNDDAILLCKPSISHQVNAYSFRRFLAVTDKSAVACQLPPRLQTNVVSDDGLVYKRRVDVNGSFGGQHRASCDPQTLIFASIVESETSEIIEIAQADAMMRLLAANPWSTYETRVISREYVSVLQSLVRGSKTYEFRAGQDILKFIPQASKLLKPIIQR